jgi:hypothetical protein
VIRRAAGLVGVSLALAVLVAVPLGVWRGAYQWLCAAIAVGLTVLPGLVTLVLAERLSKSPFGPVVALFLGTFVRLVVGFGGAVVVFLASKPTFHADPWSYWAWVLGMYLTTLVVETVLLGRASGAA